ncbi:hypothetical protein TSUD_121900 [Trifolium subterraneum]|nr:hypothetical protein TSUD_121900 [Trifolium subterraneum]
MKRGSKNKDRLSDLCDSIILHILSFLDTKQALQTCILSTRWKNVAKHLPILRLCSLNFKSHCSFGNSVSRALSLRDHSTTLHTLDLMDSYDFVELDVLKSIVEYAISHNVRFLRISITCDLQQFSPCLFSSQTLTFVDLCVHPAIERMEFPNSLNLPALTTLTLKSFYFCAGDDGCAEPFSAFNKLNTLVMVGSRTFDYPFLLNLIQELVNIKSLTVSSSTLQVLSLIPDLFKVKLTSLYNLESLQVNVKSYTFESYRVVNFLLQNSQSTKEISWYSIADICERITPLQRKTVASSLAYYYFHRVTGIPVWNRVVRFRLQDVYYRKT